MIREGMRVLVFSAHAADFCSRAGGAIIRFVEAGCTVHVHNLTFGERCESPALWAEDPNLTLEDVKEKRRAEFEAAAEILGASIDCFDFGDSPLVVGPERRLELLEAVRRFRPDLVSESLDQRCDASRPRGDHAGRVVGVFVLQCGGNQYRRCPMWATACRLL